MNLFIRNLWDMSDLYLRELRKTGASRIELQSMVARICDEIPIEEEKR